MKRNFILAFFVLLLQNAFAQDIIVKVNGDELTGRVAEITLEEILYQHPDSAQGVIHRIAKTDVFMVRFANGTKEVFTQNLPENQIAIANEISPEQMYILGREDAERYYKGNGAMWGSAACALLIPYGLAGTAVIGFTRPKANNNPVSDINYLSDPSYVKGYEDRARKKKTGKVLAGTGIGVLTGITAALIILSTAWQ